MMIILDHITEPTLLIDKQKTIQNIQRMSQKAADQNIRFRPHFKTHQSAIIGDWFRPFGTTAITVSSVEMAQYFARNGWKDITLAFSLNWRQIDMINQLAKLINLGILVESLETIEFLEQNLLADVAVWLKVDSGAHRTGVSWEQSEAFALMIDRLGRNPNIHLAGLLTHAGHTYHAANRNEICEYYLESVQRMNSLCSTLQAKGMPLLEISVGDTPGCNICEDLGNVDEIRPGNFVFFDAFQAKHGTCSLEDISIALACPVVAKHPERNEVIVYGGAIHLSKDYFMENDSANYGYVCHADAKSGWGDVIPGAYVSALSQEHGIIRFGGEGFKQVKVGELLCVLPAHSCLTVTQMHQYLCLDGEMIPTFHSYQKI